MGDERKGEHGEGLAHVGRGAYALDRQDDEVHKEHANQRHVAHEYELAEVDDGGEVARGHDVGHEGEDAVRGEVHHHTHDAHHNAVEAVDEVLEELGLLGVPLPELEPGDAADDGEHHDAHGGVGSATSEVGKDVGRDERDDDLRQRETLDRLLLGLQGGHGVLRRGLGEARAGEAGEGDDGPAEQGGDGNGAQQDGHHDAGDFAELVSDLGVGEGVHDRDEDQRNDQHLEQGDVALAHDGDPVEGRGGGIGLEAQEELDASAEHKARGQRDEHARREVCAPALESDEADEQGNEDDERHEHLPDGFWRHVTSLHVLPLASGCAGSGGTRSVGRGIVCTNNLLNT